MRQLLQKSWIRFFFSILASCRSRIGRQSSSVLMAAPHSRCRVSSTLRRLFAVFIRWCWWSKFICRFKKSGKDMRKKKKDKNYIFLLHLALVPMPHAVASWTAMHKPQQLYKSFLTFSLLKMLVIICNFCLSGHLDVGILVCMPQNCINTWWMDVFSVTGQYGLEWCTFLSTSLFISKICSSCVWRTFAILW